MSPWKDTTLPACLANLREGVDGVVNRVNGQGKNQDRLQEMGLVQGTPVKVITSGKTMLIKVGDQSLCLPKVHADKVAVVPV
jgi:Fe2+ transport system protein FeoA